MKKVLFFILVFAVCLSAQYDPNVDSYYIKVYKLGTGQGNPQGLVIAQDTSIVLSWERGDGSTAAYNSPYVRQIDTINVVVNTSYLWQSGSAQTSRTLVLEDGGYELVVTEVIGNLESSESYPIFFTCISPKKAYVPFNVVIR